MERWKGKEIGEELLRCRQCPLREIIVKFSWKSSDVSSVHPREERVSPPAFAVVSTQRYVVTWTAYLRSTRRMAHHQRDSLTRLFTKLRVSTRIDSSRKF